MKSLITRSNPRPDKLDALSLKWSVDQQIGDSKKFIVVLPVRCLDLLKQVTRKGNNRQILCPDTTTDVGKCCGLGKRLTAQKGNSFD